MRLSFANDRVLAVMAHPDDVELLCAGTLARAKADGAAIGIVVMCRGDKGAGSSGAAGNELVRCRRQEATAAARLLGAELQFFDASDGELFDSYENRKRLIEIFREFHPALVIAHAQEDYHPDHRAAGAIAEAATWLCASRGHVTALPAIAVPPRLWLADTLQMSGFSPDFYIDVSEQMELKQKMLHCHRSQIQRGADGDFAPLAALMQQQSAARGAQAGVPAAECFRWHHAFKRTGAF